jgi:hypothetical protein
MTRQFVAVVRDASLARDSIIAFEFAKTAGITGSDFAHIACVTSLCLSEPALTTLFLLLAGGSRHTGGEIIELEHCTGFKRCAQDVVIDNLKRVLSGAAGGTAA